MPRASELFYTRRSRVGRNSPDLGLDSPPDRTFQHQSHDRRNQSSVNGSNNARRLRNDLYGCDPLRRSAPSRRPSFRSTQQFGIQEHDAVPLDEGSSQHSSGSIISSGSSAGVGSRQRLSGNDRLPGSVLLARERLLERLQAVSLSGNRQVDRDLSGINRRRYNFTVGDEFSFIDAGGWETGGPRDWLTGSSLFTLSQTDQFFRRPEFNKRPPGLTQEARDHLQVEVFNNEAETSKLSRDCSICLESFGEGDELIRLPCRHRFHSACLDPWLQNCGDCPYCRRGVLVTE